MSIVEWSAKATRDATGRYVRTLTPEQFRAARAKQQRDRRAANPKLARLKARALPSRQPETRRDWQRAHRIANPELYRQRERVRALKRYGLTIAEWDMLFEAQGSVCKCCGTADPGSRKRWATDHDHKTGLVRGILCNRCNITLGLLGDDAEGVRASASRFLGYLGGA